MKYTKLTFCFLYKKYIIEKISPEEIATLLGVSRGYIFKKLHEYKIIPKRSVIDLTGKKFGKLTVIKFNNFNKDAMNSYWLCKCDCGGTKIAKAKMLRYGDCKSCGCLKPASNFRKYFNMIKRGAETRNLEFTITQEQMFDLYYKQNKKCAFSGEDIFISDILNTERTASLDRIDSKKGYLINNIQWVHRDINQIKWELSKDRLLYWAENIYKNNICGE